MKTFFEHALLLGRKEGRAFNGTKAHFANESR